MWIFLGMLMLFLGIVGLSLLSQATVGVGLICFGCILGILARLAQAEKFHKKQ